MTDARERIVGLAGELGAAAVARHPELWRADALPPDLWRDWADAGLLGLSAPAEFGGAGFGVDDVATAARAFLKTSGVQGLATIWQSHNLMADWVFNHFADAAQRAEWLPRIATGAATVAFAVSEPGAGAHPKKLQTRARQTDGGWAIDGAKAYVTNGPIASLFAVVAIVDETPAGRRRFGAFLVPADAPGLTVQPSEHVDYLKPSGHASLDLVGVKVPASARLTEAEDVYPIMVGPLRDHEDAAGVIARIGAYEHLASAFARIEGMEAAAGGIAARIRAADLALAHDGSAEGLLAARAVIGDAAAEATRAAAAAGAALSPATAALVRDLDKLGGVARYAVEARFRAFGRSLAACADAPQSVAE